MHRIFCFFTTFFLLLSVGAVCLTPNSGQNSMLALVTCSQREESHSPFCSLRLEDRPGRFSHLAARLVHLHCLGAWYPHVDKIFGALLNSGFCYGRPDTGFQISTCELNFVSAKWEAVIYILVGWSGKGGMMATFSFCFCQCSFSS